MSGSHTVDAEAPETELQRNEREAAATLAERERVVAALVLRQRAAEANLAVAEHAYREMPTEAGLSAARALRAEVQGLAAETERARADVEPAARVLADLRAIRSRNERAARWDYLRTRVIGDGLHDRIAPLVAAALGFEEKRDAALDALEAEERLVERERQEAAGVAPGGPSSLGYLSTDWAQRMLGDAAFVAYAERRRPGSGRPAPRPRGLRAAHSVTDSERARLEAWFARVTAKPT